MILHTINDFTSFFFKLGRARAQAHVSTLEHEILIYFYHRSRLF